MYVPYAHAVTPAQHAIADCVRASHHYNVVPSVYTCDVYAYLPHKRAVRHNAKSYAQYLLQRLNARGIACAVSCDHDDADSGWITVRITPLIVEYADMRNVATA